MDNAAVVVAMGANVAAVVGLFIAISNWRRDAREAVERRHQENQKALKCISEELADMRPKVQAMWARFI